MATFASNFPHEMHLCGKISTIAVKIRKKSFRNHKIQSHIFTFTNCLRFEVGMNDTPECDGDAQ